MNRYATMWAALCVAHISGAQAPFDLDQGFCTSITMKNVNSVLPLPDGDVLISGRIRFPSDQFYDRLGARLNPDGSRDLSFEGYPLMGGKIVPWTDRMYVKNGNGLRRLLLDGSLDTSFNILDQFPLFFTGQGGDYHIFSDGRALFTGSHTVNDSVHGLIGGGFSLVWFTNTGDLDTTQHHRKSNNAIYTLAVEPDGQLLVSGIYSTYEGQPAPCILRLHADGERDTTFNVPLVWGLADGITPLSGERVLASGKFLAAGSADTLQLIRLLPDGTLDPAFHNTLDAPWDLFGAGASLWHTLLPGGRIVLHGNFSEVDGEDRSGIALLDSNGVLLNDAFAGDGCGVYNDVFAPLHATLGMVPDQNGNWYIYGAYIGYDDGTTNDPQQRFVSRLYGLDVGVREAEEPVQLEVYPNPAHTSTTVRWATAGSMQLRLFDATGREGHRSAHQGTEAVLDLTGLPAGPYLIHLTDRTHRAWSRMLIVEP